MQLINCVHAWQPFSLPIPLTNFWSSLARHSRVLWFPRTKLTFLWNDAANILLDEVTRFNAHQFVHYVSAAVVFDDSHRRTHCEITWFHIDHCFPQCTVPLTTLGISSKPHSPIKEESLPASALPLSCICNHRMNKWFLDWICVEVLDVHWGSLLLLWGVWVNV